MQQQGGSNWLRSLCPFTNKLDKRDGESQIQKGDINKCVRLVIKPLRIFQFLVVLLMLVFVVYTIATGNEKVSSVSCILLIVLSGVYVFILAIDLISQFSGGELYAIPMFLFSLLGIIFFGVAGILLISVYSANGLWYILTILCLCFLITILFIIDVATILAFLKRSCNLCKQCCYTNQAEILFQKNDVCHPLCTETVKYDLMTSISNLRIPPEDEGEVPDHSYRKIGHGRRRQYVDCPTSARSLSIMGIGQVQTERNKTSNIQSQTQQEVKEILVQTVSRCELCNRQMQYFSNFSGTMQPTTQQAQCNPCPALVQLIRGAPCCPGSSTNSCRCVAGIVQVPQQSQQQQTQQQEQQPTKDQVQWMQSGDEKSYGMLTSECQREDPKLTGVSGTITKLTLASYCVTPSKKADTSSQTTSGNDGKLVKKTLEEAKKSRLPSAKKEKERERESTKEQKEVLIPEREKTKVTNNATRKETQVSQKKISVSPVQKPVKLPEKPSKTPTQEPVESLEKTSKSPIQKSVETPEVSSESSPQKPVEPPEMSSESSLQKPVEPPEKPSESLQKPAETAEKPSESLSATAETPSEKTLEETSKPKPTVSPPQQVAAMINRLQKIEETKMDVQPLETLNKTEKTLSPIKLKTKLVAKESEKLKTVSKAEKTEEQVERIVEEDGSVKEEADTVGKMANKNSRKSSLDSNGSLSDTSSDTFKEIVEASGVADKNDSSKLEKPDESIAKQVDVTKIGRSLGTVSVIKPQAGTQATDTETPNNKMKRTHFLQKKNKIGPAELTHTDMNVQTVDLEDPAKTERLSIEERRVTVENKGVNICTACNRIQGVLVSSSFQYYSVYRDKRGRMYCEFCCAPNSVKVLHRSDSTEQRRLRCAGCGNFFRVKSSQTEGTTSRNNCPKCGQTQLRVRSAVSK